jgi:hypothetical protein
VAPAERRRATAREAARSDERGHGRTMR